MESTVLKTVRLSAYYGDNCVIKTVDLAIPESRVIAVMGPSGCGKSTLIRCFNRMHELTPGARVEGRVLLREADLYQMNPIAVRTRIGMGNGFGL